MSEASNAAKKLAAEYDINLESVTGTGADGLITKDDVQSAQESAAQLNIMAKAKLERHSEQPEAAIPAITSSVVAVPTQDELLDIIKGLQGEMEDLRERTQDMEVREAQTRDLTDEYFFIQKPNGRRWEERRVVDGKMAEIEFVASTFIGPFQNEEDPEKYVAHKKSQREDAWINWQNYEVVTGREARRIDAEETAERDSHFGSSAPVNVLDQRIFAQNHGNSTVGGVGQVVGQAQ